MNASTGQWRDPKLYTLHETGVAPGINPCCKVLGLDEVHVINSGERILPFADEEISTTLREVMESLGVEFHMPDSVERVEATPALIPASTTRACPTCTSTRRTTRWTVSIAGTCFGLQRSSSCRRTRSK